MGCGSEAAIGGPDQSTKKILKESEVSPDALGQQPEGSGPDRQHLHSDMSYHAKQTPISERETNGDE